MNYKIPGRHNHRSLRLKGYDYSIEGQYFITICTKDHQHLFGNISEGKMILNETGFTAEIFLKEVSSHFSNAMVEEHVVMPNHVHLILALNSRGQFTDDDGMPGDGACHGVGTCRGAGTCRGVGPRHGVAPPSGVALPSAVPPPSGISPSANLFGKPVSGSVSVIINQYKSSVKRWCNKNGVDHFKWQSRFYDHIIRNEESRQNITDYIYNNPKNWQDDKFYLK